MLPWPPSHALPSPVSASRERKRSTGEKERMGEKENLGGEAEAMSIYIDLAGFGCEAEDAVEKLEKRMRSTRSRS